MKHRAEKPLPAPSHHGPDEVLLEMGLRLTPAERLRWLEETVEELQPWVGLASKVPTHDPSADCDQVLVDLRQYRTLT